MVLTLTRFLPALFVPRFRPVGTLVTHGKGGVSALNQDEPQKYADRAAKVSEDELRDLAAAHLLAGNWDLKGDNVTIDESGSVHIYDYDRMEKTWSDEASVEVKASRHVENKTVKNINEARKEHPDADPLDIDEVGADAVTDRAVEIATALKESGHDENVFQAVEQYARQVNSATHALRIRDNIDKLADT